MVDGNPPIEGGPGLTSDELYDVLSNRRRRYVIHALKRREQPIELGELANQIAAWESDTTEQSVSSDARKSVYTSLQQAHLPKMDEANVVEFDKDRGVVDATPNLEELDVYIEFVESEQISWHQYYLGLFLIDAVLLAAVWVGAWPFLLLPDLAWAGIVTATFGVSAIVHYFYMRDSRLGTSAKPPDLQR